MALVFFSNQGHQVFHDPCPDLDAYRWAMGVTSRIIPTNHLSDHILFSGCELLEDLFAPLPTDSLGTAFMTMYLTSPPSMSSSPLGGSAAPPHASGVRSVVSGHGFAGGVGSALGGVGISVGASGLCFDHGGSLCPRGTPTLAVGALGFRPDPDEGVPAPIQPHPGLGISSPMGGIGIHVGVSILNMAGPGVPVNTGFSHLNMGGLNVPGGASTSHEGGFGVGRIRTKGSRPLLAPIKAQVCLFPQLPLTPIADPPSPCWLRRLPLIHPVAALCSHPWFLLGVIRRSALLFGLQSAVIRRGVLCHHPPVAMAVLVGALLSLPTPSHWGCNIGVPTALSATNLIGLP